jgi:hypothetical protein
MDLLFVMRDLGVAAPAAGDTGDERSRRVLACEIDRAAGADTSTGWASRQRRPTWARTRRSSRRTRRGVAAAAVLATVASAVVALLANGGDGGFSVVARAYAATNPAGVIIHYVETSAPLQHQRGSTQTTEIEIWTYGNQSHQIVDPDDPKNRQDIVAGGGQVQTLAYGTLISSPDRDTRCPAAQVLEGCVVSANNSPIAALRVLYRSGQIHSAGVTTVDGRRLDVLSGRSGNLSIRALVDRHTFVPVKVTMTQTVTFPRTKNVVTFAMTITDYQRLPVTARNMRRLALPPHPHVQVFRLHPGVPPHKPASSN